MLKKIFKESVLYTFANQAPLIANIFVLPLITPFLTAFDYGVFGLTYAYINGFSFLSDLGMSVLFQNSFFKDKENYKTYWGKYLGFRWLWAFVYSAVLLIVLYLVFRSQMDYERLLLMLALVITPQLLFELTKTVGMRFCQYTDQHKLVYIATFFAGIITVTTTYVCVAVYQMGFMGWFISSLVAGFFQFVYFGWIIYFKNNILPTFDFDIPFLKKSFRVSLPVIPHNYSGYLISSSDRVVLDNLNTSLADLGQYNLAYSFASYFEGFNNAVNVILSPIYFRKFAENSKETKYFVRDLTFVWITFILGSGFTLCLWAREIFAYLYRNPELNQAYPYAIPIIMGMAYRPLWVACVDKAIFLEKTGSILKVSLVAGVGNVLLNLIFIPYYGIQAAVLTSFATYLFMGFAGFYIKSLSRHVELNYYPIFWFVTILASTAGAYFSRDLPILYKAIITLLLLMLAGLIYQFKGKKIISNLS